MDWTSDSIRVFRARLDLQQIDFANLLGVDARSVRRWEAGQGTPTGSAEAVLNGIQQALEDAERRGCFAVMVATITTTATAGGLPFLLYKLLTSHAAESGQSAPRPPH